MKIIMLVGLLLVGACASGNPRHAEFRSQEFVPYTESGTAEISGIVWVTHEGFRSPGRAVAKNAIVVAVPVTAYTTEWFDREIVGGESLVAADERLAAFSTRTRTDSQGRFRISGLPSGEYYITSRFSYELEDVYDTQGAMESIQAVARAHVSLTDAEHLDKVDVTQ